MTSICLTLRSSQGHMDAIRAEELGHDPHLHGKLTVADLPRDGLYKVGRQRRQYLRGARMTHLPNIARRRLLHDLWPDGRPLVEPLDPGEEGILQADIDLQDIDYAKNLIDAVGHYARPDLLSLLVAHEESLHVTMKR